MLNTFDHNCIFSTGKQNCDNRQKTIHFACDNPSDKYTKMYLKSIYVMLSILQIHLHIFVVISNTLQLCLLYTKLAHLNSAKLDTTNCVLNAL